jgi:MFS family permease
MTVTAGAQLLDNVYMAGVNISLPTIQKEFNVRSANLQWLVSAYTLTFGGFLLLADVLSDRYGQKNIFCTSML